MLQPAAKQQSESPPQVKFPSSRWLPRDEALSPDRFTKGVGVSSLEGVEPAAVRWIAAGRVPQGALCVVAGESGSCKSLLAVEWAARASEGAEDRDAALIAHAADMPAPILRARLDSAGAVIDRVAAATLRWPLPGDDCSFDELDRRVMALACGIQEGRAANLLIVDSLEAWAGSLDQKHCRARASHLLAKLAELAVKTQTAVVVLARLNGPAGGRVASRELAELSAIAPVVWLAAQDAEAPTRRLLLPVKNSLGPAMPGAAFRIEAGRVVWEQEPVDLSAATIVPPSARSITAQGDRESAAEWLLSALSHGSIESAELFRQARSCGISATTLRRAAKGLGLKPTKTTFDGPWSWALGEEVGNRNSEVAREDQRGTRIEECGSREQREQAEAPNLTEVRQRDEGGQVRAEKLVAVQRKKEDRRGRRLELGKLDEKYDFSVFPLPLGGLKAPIQG